MKQVITSKYKIKSFGDKYFLTTDSGRGCVLNKEEYELFKKDCFTEELIRKLKLSFVVVDGSNVLDNLGLLRNRYEKIFSGASLHIIVVTLRCNMHCMYCQVGRKFCDKEGYDMDEKTAKQTVDFIFQTPNDDITIEFQGGEPTLNWPVLKFIIEYAEKKNKEAKKNVEITMVTNMTTMTEERMKYLLDHKVDVCTSLDGNEVVHNFNRKYDKNNHLEVLAWIGFFNEEYKKRNMSNRMSALVTLTKESLKYPKEIIDTYVKLGIEVIHLRKLTKLGFAKAQWNKISYSTEEYLEFWLKAVKYIDELQKQGVNINERMVLMIYDKINNDEDVDYMDLRSPCGACIGQIAYNYDGDIYSCDEARMMKIDKFKLGNVNDSSYQDIIKCGKCSDLILDSTLSQFECCEECVYQSYCGVCPVLNYDMYGKTIVNPEDTDICKINKFQFDWVVKRFFLEN